MHKIPNMERYLRYLTPACSGQNVSDVCVGDITTANLNAGVLPPLKDGADDKTFGGAGFVAATHYARLMGGYFEEVQAKGGHCIHAALDCCSPVSAI